MELRMTPMAHRFCLWMGPLFCLLYLVGYLILCRFMPIPSPSWEAERLSDWIADHRTRYQAGCLCMIVGAGLMGPWGASLAIWTRKTEVRFPVLYLAQIVSLSASVALFVIIEIFWATAGLRAGEIDPQITQQFFDAGWFAFLWAGPVFYLWAIFLGLGIIWNPPEHQLYPRWAGYYTLASVVCWSMGLLMVFFKSGPVAYSGALPTHIAVIEFFCWVVVMTVMGHRAINKQEALCRLEDESKGLGIYVAANAPLPDDDELAGLPSSWNVTVGGR